MAELIILLLRYHTLALIVHLQMLLLLIPKCVQIPGWNMFNRHILRSSVP